MADRARLQGCYKAVATILGRRRRFWATHECNFFIAPRQKRFSGQLPGGKIIDAKCVDARRLRMATKTMHHWNASAVKGLSKAHGQGGGGHNHTIDRILFKHADRIGRIHLTREVDQQRAQTAILQALGHQIKDLQKNRVVKIVGNDPDKFCTTSGER